MRRFVSIAFLGSLLLVFGLVVGCSDSTYDPQELSGEGRLQISLIDAPGDYDEVNVEIIEVRVHRNQAADSLSGWHTISTDTMLVNLLELTEGNSVILADTTLLAGHYEQIRLILGGNNTVVVDSVAHPLEVPSSAQSGLKLNHGFWIEEGTIYSVTLDFDADRSIHCTGNGRYKMKPVIRVCVDGVSGSLRGAVEPIEARARILTIADQDTVIAYADTLTGHFHFPMLVEGAYDLEIGATAGAYLDTVLAGVTVSAGLDTDIGTVVLRDETAPPEE
jgi:hypothetical protein